MFLFVKYWVDLINYKQKQMIDLLQIWVKKIKINDAKQVADLYHGNGCWRFG